MNSQITIEEWLKTINPDCRNCQYEEIDIYCGLGMCRHPDVMRFHSRTRGKFSARYDGVDHPVWCPLMDPERWKPYKEEKLC